MQPGKVIAKLSWTLANTPGSQQRVDLSMYWNGFETGNFETIGPLPPDQSVVESDELKSGIYYYWRVVTLTPEGWVPSETANCAVRFCPGGRALEKVP